MAQVKHDNSCMRELALLLGVDTMQMADKVSELEETVSRKNMIEKAVRPLVSDKSVQIPQQSTASSSNNLTGLSSETWTVTLHSILSQPRKLEKTNKQQQTQKESPWTIPTAGHQAIVEALCNKFKENESSAQLNAYMNLKTVRMEGNVTSYCLELEKITQRAYPGASEKELRAQEHQNWLRSYPIGQNIFSCTRQWN
ncbi:hypothetical protein COOONC_09913 [Cooperia oncophora]